MNKIITIIIATFNASKTIERCIKSILSQKNENVELIIIDGASRDNTVDILREYESDIDVLISEKDNGIYNAWNKCITKACGDWLMFIGADDILIEGALDKYLDFISDMKESRDYICARNEYVTENDVFLKLIGSEYKWDIFRYRMDVAHVGSLHNKKLFKEVGLYNLDFKICADYELLMRKKSKLQCGFVNHTIARMQTGGMSYSVNAIKEAYNITKLHNSIPPFGNVSVFVFNDMVLQLSKVKADIKVRR